MKGEKVEVIEEHEPEVERTVCGDMERFQQVLYNLVTNAIKFVPRSLGIIKIASKIFK